MCKYKGDKPACIMKVTVVGSPQGAQSAGQHPLGERSECEHTCWDPKDSELCLSRMKPGETLVEACSDSDVQIDHQIWIVAKDYSNHLVAGSLQIFPQDSCN